MNINIHKENIINANIHININIYVYYEYQCYECHKNIIYQTYVTRVRVPLLIYL